MGEVSLLVRLMNSEHGEPVLQFIVMDTGVGMNHRQIANLFQPFTQAESSTTRKYGGTDLGLTICKRLIEMLKGAISVTSQPGEGTTFLVSIPTGSLEGVELLENPQEAELRPRQADQETAEEFDSLDCRVLLAEDGPDNQRLISFVLQKAGAEVTLADNGQNAVELALAAQGEGRPFDVILMDMQMPILDGYAAARKLRDQGYRKPIIALTAHAMSSDRDKCIAAGCDDYLSKPIHRTEFVAMVGKYAGQVQQA